MLLGIALIGDLFPSRLGRIWEYDELLPRCCRRGSGRQHRENNKSETLHVDLSRSRKSSSAFHTCLASPTLSDRIPGWQPSDQSRHSSRTDLALCSRVRETKQ